MKINRVELKYPLVFTCCSCDNQNIKGWHVSNVPTGTRDGYYCEPCYNFDIKPLTEKPMTSIQEQHQLASEWHAEMAVNGTAFEVQTRWIKSDGKIPNYWLTVDRPLWDFENQEFRRKPTSKLIPWTFEDITPEISGAWFQTLTTIRHVVFFSPQGLTLGDQPANTTVDWEQLKTTWKYSTDLKTWKPCGKVSE